jgi:hypothetical protein
MQRPNSLPTFLSLPAFWVFSVTLIVRIVVLGRFADTPFLFPYGDDMYFYHSWAQRILAGQWTDHQAFYGLPGYAFLLALTYQILQVQPFYIGLIQCVVEAFTSLVIYRLGCETFASVRTRLSSGTNFGEAQWIGALGGIGWAFFIPAQTFSIILMPTCWLVLAFWGCLL